MCSLEYLFTVQDLTENCILESQNSPAFLPSLILRVFFLETMQGKRRNKGYVWLLLSLNLGLIVFFFSLLNFLINFFLFLVMFNLTNRCSFYSL